MRPTRRRNSGSSREAAKAVWAKAGDATFDVARIDEIEREIHHDVIAFTTHLAEIVGPRRASCIRA